MAVTDEGVGTVPLADLRPFPHNARNGDTEAIMESIRVNGFFRPLVISSDNVVLAGNHAYAAAMELGLTEVPVFRVAVHSESVEATKIVLADNRTSDRARYDDAALLDLLRTIEDDLYGTAFTADDLAHLAHITDGDLSGLLRDAEIETGRGMKPKPRTMPLRLVFSSTSSLDAAVALSMGWRNGIISTSASSWARLTERFRMPRCAFMDNDWHDYDHAKHLAGVRLVEPESCTTRDILTKEQCAELGIDHFTLDETLDMAAELAEHVDDIILIPKYDCIEALPTTIGSARVILGYSVETSYGGTEVPIEAFRGRPIHLLGGSWDKQRAYLNLMGDDVVALDNNMILRVAEFGQYSTADGPTATLTDLLGHDIQSARFAALALSLAEIANAVRTQFAAAADPWSTE